VGPTPDEPTIISSQMNVTETMEEIQTKSGPKVYHGDGRLPAASQPQAAPQETASPPSPPHEEVSPTTDLCWVGVGREPEQHNLVTFNSVNELPHQVWASKGVDGYGIPRSVYLRPLVKVDPHNLPDWYLRQETINRVEQLVRAQEALTANSSSRKASYRPSQRKRMKSVRDRQWGAIRLSNAATMEALPHVVFDDDKELSDYPLPIINDLSQKRRQKKRRSLDIERDRMPEGATPGDSDSSSSTSSNGSEREASSGDIEQTNYSYSSGSEGETDGNEEYSEASFNGASRRLTVYAALAVGGNPALTQAGKTCRGRW
jgi:hypothetical protein